MSSVNKVILVGRLGADPEMRQVSDSASVCRLSVATNRKWTDRHGERREEVVWHRVSVWGKHGESCQRFLSKGQAVYVEGRLRSYRFTDDQGNPRNGTEVVSSHVVFLPRSRLEAEGNGEVATEDALPF